MPAFSSRNIHTVYDRMEAVGVFEANPANAHSRDKLSGEALYKGPVQFPCMVYHPEGKTRVSVPASPGQAQQTEVIWKLAANKDEYDSLRKLGWHDHPSDAIVAGGGDAVPKGAMDTVAQLERQIAEQKAEIARLRSAPLQDDQKEE